MSDDNNSPELPPASFIVIVEQLTIQAMAEMGAIPNPMTGQASVSLERARFTIDLLQRLRDKTDGNLDPDEKDHLDNRIGELQLSFLKLAGDDFMDG